MWSRKGMPVAISVRPRPSSSSSSSTSVSRVWRRTLLLGDMTLFSLGLATDALGVLAP